MRVKSIYLQVLLHTLEASCSKLCFYTKAYSSATSGDTSLLKRLFLLMLNGDSDADTSLPREITAGRDSSAIF